MKTADTAISPPPEVSCAASAAVGPPMQTGGGSSPKSPRSCHIYGIYCEVNEKWYVGKTLHWTSRVTQHLHALKHHKHHSQPLQRAWDKYGSASFLWVLFTSVPEHLSGLAELAQTRKLNAIAPNGFVLKAGDRRGTVSDETRQRMSVAQRGHTTSKEARANIGAAQLGRPRSAETKARIKQTLTGRKRPESFCKAMAAYWARKLKAKQIAAKAPSGYSQCSKCKQWKPFSQFYKDPRALDGCHSACKQCESTGLKTKPQTKRTTKCKN